MNEGYGESCLEMAEELANETPVRLDLLLSLIPPQPDSAGVQSPTGAVSVPSVAPDETIKTVIPTTTTTNTTKTAKTDGDESNSMNEYYDGKTAVAPATAGTEPTEGAKTKKKKEVSSSSPSTQHSKKRRAEAVVEEKPLLPPIDPSVDETQSCGPSPIDDSGIQSTIEAAIAMSEEIVAAAIPKAVAVTSAEAKQESEKVKQQVTPALPPDVEMDEGIVLSTSNSTTKVVATVGPAAASVPTIPPMCQQEPTSAQPVDRKQLKVKITNELPEKIMSNETGAQTATTKEEKQMTPLTPPSPPSPPTPSVNESLQSPEPEATNSSTSNATRRPRNSSSATSAAASSEHRHSKILLRQAELFNNLTHARTDPPAPKNTMTLERPKKVTLYGFKVRCPAQNQASGHCYLSHSSYLFPSFPQTH